MNPADRSALIDRLARARAWNAYADHERELFRRKATADLDELDVARVQIQRIGWMLIDTDTADAEDQGAEA